MIFSSLSPLLGPGGESRHSKAVQDLEHIAALIVPNFLLGNFLTMTRSIVVTMNRPQSQVQVR